MTQAGRSTSRTAHGVQSPSRFPDIFMVICCGSIVSVMVPSYVSLLIDVTSGCNCRKDFQAVSYQTRVLGVTFFRYWRSRSNRSKERIEGGHGDRTSFLTLLSPLSSGNSLRSK